MDKELITVIVPVYNTELYLKRCVDSILNQTYKCLEILLVDDGSPDNSGVLCDEYADKDERIKVIHKKMVDYRLLGMQELTEHQESIYRLLILMILLIRI